MRPVPGSGALRLRLICLLVVAGLWVATPALGPGSAAVQQDRLDTAPPADCYDPSEPSDRTVSVSAAVGPEGVVDLTFAPNSSLPGGVRVDAGHVVDAVGFRTERGELVADPSAPRHVLRLAPAAFPSSNRRTSGPTWALVRRPEIEGATAAYAGAFDGRAFLLVGSYDTHTRRVGCQRFTVVVPAAADPSVPPDRALRTLALGAREIDVGRQWRHVTAYISPVAIAADVGGFTPPRSGEFVVDEDAPAAGAWNPWLHEYVHTQQRLARRPSFAWYAEASATYFSARGALEAGVATPREYDAVMARSQVAPALTGVRQRHDRFRPYYHGFAALNRLDAHLVATTDASLETVVGGLRAPTYADFRSSLARAGADSTGLRRLDTTMQRGARPTPTYLVGPPWLPDRVRLYIPLLARHRYRVIGLVALLGITLFEAVYTLTRE